MVRKDGRRAGAVCHDGNQWGRKCQTQRNEQW